MKSEGMGKSQSPSSLPERHFPVFGKMYSPGDTRSKTVTTAAGALFERNL